MAIAPTIKEHIEIVQGAGGPKAVIAGHRVRVIEIVLWHEKLGLNVDEILEYVPSITPADVYAALAYYWDHRDEIEASIEVERALIDELAANAPSLIDRKLASERSGTASIPA